MQFEFVNTTISFAATLMAAILGIFYPLFLGSIRQIDEQYSSTVLASLFQQEESFRMYRIVLLISLCVSFVSPFLLLVCVNAVCRIVIVTIQIMLVFGLTIIMIYLFDVIRKYYSPEQLTEYLFNEENKKKPIDRNLLFCAVDLMRYASKCYDEKVYKCSRDFVGMYAIQKQNQLQNIDGENNVSVLDSDIRDTFWKMTVCARDLTMQPLCNDCLVAEIVFNPAQKGKNYFQNYSDVWNMLMDVVGSSNYVWFSKFINQIIKYYYALEQNPKKDSKSFLAIMHCCLGAMLVSTEKYDFIHCMLVRYLSEDTKMRLVPNTVNYVIGVIELMNNSVDNGDKGILNLFPFINIEDNERAKTLLKDCVSKFGTLLIIRLCSYKDNAEIINEITNDFGRIDIIPFVTCNQIVDNLESNISYWYSFNRVDAVKMLKTPAAEVVNSLFLDIRRKISELYNR